MEKTISGLSYSYYGKIQCAGKSQKTSFGLQSKLSLIQLKLRHFFFPLITIEREREREGTIIGANLLQPHCRVVDKAIFPYHNRPPFRVAT